ncbi:hypothetical protein F2Q70_00043445 [Brassica cretica]|uniref:Uncharacterized protein n=1 Tax=Brassica cretica TaxID=69181 RepID=A0A8S9KGF3_BRACR|nr:hypothetical protein F2Q70_00043445 [Brassica cretica]
MLAIINFHGEIPFFYNLQLGHRRPIPAEKSTRGKLLSGSLRQNVTRFKLHRLFNEGVRAWALFMFRSDAFSVPIQSLTRSRGFLMLTVTGPGVDLLIPNKATKP